MQSRKENNKTRSLLSICLERTGDAMLHWIENGYLLEQRIENLRRELIPAQARHQYNTKRFESLKRTQRHLIPSVTRTVKEIRFNKTLLKKMCKIKSGITVSRKFQYRVLRFNASSRNSSSLPAILRASSIILSCFSNFSSFAFLSGSVIESIFCFLID